MTYRVVFAPEAEDQLSALYAYIAAEATPGIAIRYTEAIIGYCESLATFPYRACGAMTYGGAFASRTTRSER
jgi:plasmid stabilization system protein ParE